MKLSEQAAERRRGFRAITGAWLSCVAFAAAAAAQDIPIPVGGPQDGSLAASTAIPRPAGIARTSTGTLYFSSTDTGRIYKVDSAGRLYLVAGNGNVAGVDGIPAVEARLIRPVGIALDPSGDLFIAESGRNRIRRVNLTSGVITTVAGEGGELNNPLAIASDGGSGILIADAGNHRIRRVDIFSGVTTTLAGTGTAGSGGDGAAAINAELNYPTGVAVGAAGNVFIADSLNNRVRKITSQTGIITTQTSLPAGNLACDSLGNIYVVSRIAATIERIDAGSGVVSHWVGNATPGFSGDLLLAYSTSINTTETSGLAFDSSDGIWLADSENFRIRRMVMTTGVLQTVAGNGAPLDGGALAAGASGNLFVADPISRRINKVDANTGFVATAAGGGPGSGDGDGFPATEASFKAPAHVAVDAAGNLFIGDTSVVRRVDAVTGLVSTIAGRASQHGFSGDGGPATDARLGCCFLPLAVDRNGNLFLADRGNNRIRRVDSATGIIASVAVNGIALRSPSALAFDGSGQLLVADKGNHRVMRVNVATGAATTLAGNGSIGESGATGDGGPATAASVNNPQGLTVDASGNVFIAESGGAIRRVDAGSGVISTIAGHVLPSSPLLTSPRGIVIDATGRLVVADLLNSRIERIVATLPPSISVGGARAVAPGTMVTATFSHGPGMARDWVGVYQLGSSSLIDWTYLNGTKAVPTGPVTGGTVPVRMPSAPGSYQIRFYSGLNVLQATSETVTVDAASVTVTVTPATIAAGGAVSATVTGGPANRNDWLGVHESGSANYVKWVYLNGSQSAPAAGMANTTTSITMPTTPGTYTIKFYAGSTVLASSATITVTPAATGATLTATPATIRPQGTVNANVAGGPGNTTDWVALYPTGSSTYLEWKYLNGSMTAPAVGLTGATVPFTMPVTPGSYVLKLWSGGTLLATSAPITVGHPSLTLHTTSAAPGQIVTPTVANGPGRTNDWIGIFVTGAVSYIDWVYLNGSKTAPAAGMWNTTVPVTLPALPASYTLKLFTGATELAVSEPVTVR